MVVRLISFQEMSVSFTPVLIGFILAAIVGVSIIAFVAYTCLRSSSVEPGYKLPMSECVEKAQPGWE